MRKEAEWLTNADYCSNLAVRISEELEEVEAKWQDTQHDEDKVCPKPDSNKVFLFLVRKNKITEQPLLGILGLVSRRRCLLIQLGPCESLKLKHLTNIKQAQKQVMSGNYFRVTMFGVLFSVTQKWWKCEKKGSRRFPVVNLYNVQISCQLREKHNCH